MLQIITLFYKSFKSFCPGGMGTEGPCVEEFRSAFSCWMFSAADDQGGEKGDDCVDHFFSMSNCMQQNEVIFIY